MLDNPEAGEGALWTDEERALERLAKGTRKVNSGFEHYLRCSRLGSRAEPHSEQDDAYSQAIAGAPMAGGAGCFERRRRSAGASKRP